MSKSLPIIPFMLLLCVGEKFSFTHELFPEFSPTHGMADHEIAARASAQQIFDGLLVKSCWFHYE